MPKQKLDATFCLVAQPKEGKSKTEYFDTIITGFTLESRQSGSTFYLRYFDKNGRQRQYKIGRYGDVTVEQARKEAKRLRSMVTLGRDPAADREVDRAVQTYEEFSKTHLDFAKSYQRSYETTEMYMRVHIVPKWGKIVLSEIKQPDVARWLAAKEAEGLSRGTVEKIRSIFGRSFELAIRWDTPGVIRNPVRGIPRKPLNNARDRFLTSEEAARLLEVAGGSRNPRLKAIISLLMLTGARISELLNAEWKHVDVERRVWLIPTSKTGKSRHVPLSQAAVDIIDELPRFEKCPYLLPNPKTKKPFTELKHAWQRARRDAGLPDLRIHDLRHSAASFMVNAGIDLYAVGRVLGHANHASTQRYAHVANDTLLKAVEAGAAKLAADWTH